MSKNSIEEKCRAVRLVITDVDGVLTDGGMYYSENGDELKKFNVRDGAGTVLLQMAGLRVGAFTGEATQLVERRLRKIGMDFMFKQVKDKNACLDQYLSENGYDHNEVAYIGDEINDYCLLGRVGIFFAVADASPLIRDQADHVLKTIGGQGALRETALIILDAQGKTEHALASYLEKSRHKPNSHQDNGVHVTFINELI